MKMTVTKKPDTETHPDRVWLAEIRDEEGVVDAAYFKTKADADAWARRSYGRHLS